MYGEENLYASESNPYLLDFEVLGDNNTDVEQSKTIKTINNNNIVIKYANVISNDGGWQIVRPNGYFYNPINNNAHNNKISGIKSIKYTSNENSSLSLHYGYSINNEQIIYSNSETLEANSKYVFDTERPSYFYIKNEGTNNVDIDKFEIEYSCEENDYPRNNLKVLMIGNSFADDTLFYSARIANSYGINLELYDSYIGGCTINQHYNNLCNNNASYSMRRMNGDEWDYTDGQTLSQIINYKNWDIITFQQASAEIGRANSYSNLANLVSEVRSIVGNGPKFYWHQTWAYDSTYMEYYDYFSYFNNNPVTMYNAIIDCYENEVEPLDLFDKFIPAGTAVQNLRTSYMKENFTRDGKHMSGAHGRYLLGLNFISTIMNIDLDLSPSEFVPAEINSSFKKVAYEAIRNARNNPRSITNSIYTTTEIADYDLSNYVEIDPGFVGCSYYNSTDSSNYNKRQGNTKGTSNLYVTTNRFTSTTLPVGSLVFSPEGFGYRPEAWTSDSVQYSRPNESYQNVLEITDDFWSSYQYRAFNIFKSGKTPLSDQYVDEQYHQIFDSFHIFVPKASAAGLKTLDQNDYYENDSDLFSNNGLDIDTYERVRLDPIIGFYKCDSYYSLMNSYIDTTAQRFVCTRPFASNNGDLSEGTVIIVDSGFQWRSDCWGDHGTHERPNNVSTNFTALTSEFMSGLRVRTFNVSKTDNSTLVNQNAIEFMNHMRIYKPIQGVDIPVTGVSINPDSLTVGVGTNYKLKAVITPSNASYKAVVWSSDAPGVASISSNGTITANSIGYATITVETLDGGYTAYCTIEVIAASTYPTGTFRGIAYYNYINSNLLISIGTRDNGLVGVKFRTQDIQATGISYNDLTKEFTIITAGSYDGYTFGNIIGTYDDTYEELTNITITGTINEYVYNNGTIYATRPTFRADCDGTTEELQSQFKRRYMSGSWQVDNSNADRLTSNTTEYVSGIGALKRRGYSSNAVALNFNNDFSPAITVSNVSFWVYNPSGNNITLRMWGYKGTGLSSNFETANITARSNQWTFINMYFEEKTIYNWQIADFQNTGVYLTFDEICFF